MKLDLGAISLGAILAGIGTGVVLCLVAGFLVEGALGISLSGFVRTLITFLPGSLVAAREGKGAEVLNAVLTGLFFLLASTVNFLVTYSFNFSDILAFALQSFLALFVCVAGGMMVKIFRG